MISINDAYKMMKNLTDYPLESLYKNDRYVLGENSKYFLLNRESEKIDIYYEYLDMSVFDENLTPVYHQELFDDFSAYYSIHNDEKDLAEQYAIAWKQIYFSKNETNNEKDSISDATRISMRWNEIEKELYVDIRKKMDNENYYYPPCMLDHMDDSFYHIKPFMLKNGYTVATRDKIWVKKY